MPDFAARRTMMVDTQIRPSDVTKFPIIEAFLTVPREHFVPAGREEAAYVGDNLNLDTGRVMLEPRTLAKMLDALNLGPEDLVLLVGAGLGYTAAITGHIAQAVVALESNELLASDAQTVLAEQEV
ncbi:MAG: protein-L-isoaspartate O-methyltransferase, partial [Pseudomonadota bacterium]